MADQRQLSAAPDSPTRGLGLVWGYVRRRPRPYLLGMALGAGASALALLQPLVTRGLIGDMSSHRGIAGAIGILIGLFIGAALLGALEEYVLEAAGESLVHDLRTRVSAHVLRLPLESHNHFQAGDLISRVTADTSVLQNLVTTDAADTVIGVLGMTAAIIVMATLDPVLLACSMSTLVVAAVVVAKMFPRARRASIRSQRSLGQVSSALERSLRAVRTVKASRAEGRETTRIEQESAAVRDAGLAIARFQATVDPTVNLAVQGSLVIVLGVGAAQASAGAIHLGTLIAFLMYLTRVIQPVTQLFGFSQNLQRGSAADLRLREVLDLTVEDVNTPPGSEETAVLPGVIGAGGAVAVAFDDVTFTYHDEAPVLEHVSFRVAPGSCVALVGPSGAGKSTIFNLLAGFYTPDAGRVLVDGVDTRNIPLSELRGILALVEQDAPVMDGTIADNIRYAAPDSSEDQVATAVAQSGLGPLTETLAQGLQTPTGNSGSLLSGGERQRVAMARALLASSRLLLLDEVTSQLDSISERDMRETIQAAASARCTVLVVAHRLSTVLQADQIVVLRDHRVDAIGSHHELLQTCLFYQELVSAQFSAPETRAGRPLPTGTPMLTPAEQP